MGSCIIKPTWKNKSKVEDSSRSPTGENLSFEQVAVIKNNWKKINGILHRVGKIILLG